MSAWKRDGRLVLDEQGDAIAMVNVARPVKTAHEHADLIAAAPELLDALRAMMVYESHTPRLDDYANGASPSWGQLLIDANCAIAKAEGRYAVRQADALLAELAK